MRPGTGLDPTSPEPSRPRKASNAEASSLTGDRDRSNQATTFFLCRDPDVSPRNQRSERTSTSSFTDSPLTSLQDAVREADRSVRYNTSARSPEGSVRSGSRRRSTIKPGTAGRLLRRESGNTSADGGASTTARYTPPEDETTRSTTPSPLPSQNVSLPSSPRSLASRQSRSKSSYASDDEVLTSADETGSQVILSSGEEDDNEAQMGRSAHIELPRLLADSVQDSQPELIMPSIKMPSRRPFTPRGKRLGRFKIMVAGSKGVGKTSLIKSMVQLCEDIVHVDTIAASTNPSPHWRPNLDSTSEIYASTKPYPEWWSTIEESRILRRRKSMGDSVLERNICFVDTTDSAKLDRIINYAEQQLINAMKSMDQLSGEFSGLLSGRGASQVDVILYLISKDTLQDDADRIRQLSEICNVVPLIAKSDLLSPQEQDHLKQSVDSVVSSLARLLGPATSSEAVTTLTPEPDRQPALATAPYSVTSTNGPDLDTMEASLLMSPEYIQPLLPSELSLLVDQLFEPETVAYLRHTAARKLVAWHASHPRITVAPRTPSPAASHHPLSPSMRNSILTSPVQRSYSPSQSGGLLPIGSEVSLNTSNSWALAKVADHTQREERLAQIRLSKWASELQLSLQRERERYERLARGERAGWLVDRIGEEVRNGKIVSIGNAQALAHKNGKGSIMYGDGESIPMYQMHDPMGLLRWHDSMRTRGWIALQIVGSFGVMGGFAFWLAKHFGMLGSFNDWCTQGWEYFGWHD